jgi:DNA replication protein
MSRPVDDLVKITTAGAGLILDGQTQSTDDLIKIAGAAAESEALLTIKNVGGKTTDELIKIAAAGDGSVVFEL